MFLLMWRIWRATVFLLPLQRLACLCLMMQNVMLFRWMIWRILTLRFLKRDNALKPRQIVLTEGSGGLFPRGLTIGRILETRPDASGLLEEALVEPTADPTLLRTVFVLTKRSSASSRATEGETP